MRNWLLLACLATPLLPACAWPQKTAMIECPSSGCPEPTPPIPDRAELSRLASRDLACPVEQLRLSDIGPRRDWSGGPWQASGCGKATVYLRSSYGFKRTSVVAAF